MASALVGIGFGVKSILDAKKAAKKQKAIGRQNAALLQQEAANALVRGEQLAKQQESHQREVFSRQIAVQSGALLNPNFGSAVDVRATSAYFLAIDALNIRENAESEFRSLSAQSVIARRGGAVAAAATRAQGVASGAQSISAGVSSAASEFRTGGSLEGVFN